MASIPEATPACQVPPPVLPDILPYYLPGGGLSLLAGAPGVGKTALLAGLLRDLRDRRPIFGRHPIALPGIGLVNADRGWAKGAGLWFARAGYPEIQYYSLADDPEFNPKRLRKKFDRTDILAGLIDRLELPPFSLVSVDPISLFLGGNLLDYDTCLVACGEIRAYLRLRQYTLLGTAHTAKLKTNKQDRYVRMQDQMFGSTAIAGFSDSQLYLASPLETKKGYYTLVWHPHGAIEEHHCLERDEQGLFIPYSGVDKQTQARVLTLVPQDGTAITFGALVELAEALPLSRRTVRNVLDQLIEGQVIEHVKHGAYRRLTLQ